MGVVFFGLSSDGESMEKVGKVENGEIVEDPDEELEQTLQGEPLQDGYLSAKFNNRLLDGRLTQDVADKESGRVYITFGVNVPEDKEIKESEYGAEYYEA